MQIVEEISVAPPRMTGVAGALQKAEQWLGSTVSAIAALLVVAEIIVLFTGVSERSDELAGILFLWLAMLGAVVAFQRGEYMDDGSCRKGRSAQARIVAGRSVTAVVVRQLAAGIHPDIKPMLVTCWRS